MTKNILIVDDEKDMLLSLKEGFDTYGEIFSVLLAEDGEKAVDKLKENVISLVVTDLRMPRMDGFSLLIHIMTHYPDIPVIIMTAYSRPVMERMAMKIGAVEYIEKPFRMDDLAQKIISILEKESDGGIFTSVSSGMFTQLIEMEPSDWSTGHQTSAACFFSGRESYSMQESVMSRVNQPPLRY